MHYILKLIGNAATSLEAHPFAKCTITVHEFDVFTDTFNIKPYTVFKKNLLLILLESIPPYTPQEKQKSLVFDIPVLTHGIEAKHTRKSKTY